MSRVNLKIQTGTHAESVQAVEAWHYSRSIPGGARLALAVRESGRFVGVVIFGSGANRNIGRPYGLPASEVWELTRVALGPHVTPVSRILSICVRLLKQQRPGLRLIVSYADPEHGHHGGIYQAAGWTYTGRTKRQRACIRGGRRVHKRTVGKTAGMKLSALLWKHKYVLPLDAEMRERVTPLAQPYPRRRCSQRHAGQSRPEGAVQVRPRRSLRVA